MFKLVIDMWDVYSQQQQKSYSAVYEIITKFYTSLCNAEELSRIHQYIVMNTNFYKCKNNYL